MSYRHQTPDSKGRVGCSFDNPPGSLQVWRIGETPERAKAENLHSSDKAGC